MVISFLRGIPAASALGRSRAVVAGFSCARITNLVEVRKRHAFYLLIYKSEETCLVAS